MSTVQVPGVAGAVGAAERRSTGSPMKTAPEPRTPRRPRDVAVAVGVPTLVLALHAATYGPWIEDDAGITFAYARSLATGEGAVLQPGAAPVEGFSNPLWLAVLVVGRAVGLFDRGAWFGVPDLVLFPKLVALACAAAMFGLVLGLARSVTRHPVAASATASTITALVPSYVIWSMSGLENSLYALLVVALAVALARAAVAGRLLETRLAVVVGLLAGLAALTRPDGLIYLAAHPMVLALVRAGPRGPALRAAARSVGAAATLVGIYLVVRLAVFGDWLPNTARAKRQGVPSVTDLVRPGALVTYAGWLGVLVAAGAAILVLAARSRARTAVAVLLVPLGLALAAFAALPPDWMAQYRFATPVWPLGAIVAVVATAEVWRQAARRGRAILAVLAVLAAVVSATVWLDVAATFRAEPTAPMCFVAFSNGERVNEYADILRVRDGTLLAVDGGGTSLTTRLRFVDLSGLTDATIADLWQRGDPRALRDHVYETVRPTFIKIEAGWTDGPWTGLLADPRLGRDYVAVIAPGPGTGTFVRRDAIPDQTSLSRAREYATRALYGIDVPFLRGDHAAWLCGPVLRPR